MKYSIFLILMLFSVGSFAQEQVGEEQKQASQMEEEFNICSFLTDVNLFFKYSNLELVCVMRKKQSGEECFQYLQKRSIVTEFKTLQELHNLLGRFWSGEIVKAIPEEASISWLSLSEAIKERCGEVLMKELSVEEQEKIVFDGVECISTDIVIRKQEYNCSVE